MKFRARFQDFCPFFLLALCKSEHYEYTDFFRKKVSDAVKQLIFDESKKKSLSKCSDHDCIISAETDYPVKFCAIKIDQRDGHVFSDQPLVIDNKSIYYQKCGQSIFVHDYTCKDILPRLKPYSKFSKVSQFAFWVLDIEKFLGVKIGPIAKNTVAKIASQIKRGIEIYELKRDFLVKILYDAAYPGNEPVRLIIPCPGIDYLPVLVIYNSNILEFSEVRKSFNEN